MNNKIGKTIEENLEMNMVDFYEEHEYIIKLGLASSKPDIEYINWCRVRANDNSVINPKDGLMLKNAQIICGGKNIGLDCNGIIKVSHPDLQTPDGDLLLQMEGPFKYYSKCLFTCSCGISYEICTDATVGGPNECYVMVTRRNKPGKAFLVRPFFETEKINIVNLNI